MQRKGITKPGPKVRAATEQLVAKLRALSPDESIETSGSWGKADYIRASTGEILAHVEKDT